MATRSALAARARPAPKARGGLILGSLLEIWSDPLRLMLDSTLDCGEVHQLRLPFVRYIVVADPEGIRHVLVHNAKNYVKSRNYRGLRIALGDGLLTAEGEHWRQQRRLIQPGFHRDHLRGFAQTMTECTKDMLDRWDGEVGQSPADIHAEMMRLTFRIVGRALLSAELDGDAKAIGEAFNVVLRWANEYVESPWRLPPWMPTPTNVRFNRARRTIRDIVLRIIRERRRANAPNRDLLALLMEARDEEGQGMSDPDLLDELLTLVLAGHETTANALTFTLLLLSEHPEILAKLAEEVAEVLAGRVPSLADLPRLAYTTQVIEESLRLYPPAWLIEREALEDDVVCGVHIPRRSILAVSPFVTHRLPRLWPCPEDFDPARFTKDKKDARHKHAYLPFGGGPRACIGGGFAMMELQLVLPMIVQRYRLELSPGYRLALDPSITLRPKGGVSIHGRRIGPRG